MTRFRDQYIQNWNSQLSRTSSRKGSAGNKLRTYRLFKTTFELEPYLYLTKIIKHLVALTRLRISCHSLEIERGRYHKPASTSAHLRLCKDCESVEDELNFVCVCPKYDSLREHLVSIVCNDNPIYNIIHPSYPYTHCQFGYTAEQMCGHKQNGIHALHYRVEDGKGYGFWLWIMDTRLN